MKKYINTETLYFYNYGICDRNYRLSRKGYTYLNENGEEWLSYAVRGYLTNKSWKKLDNQDEPSFNNRQEGKVK